MTQAMASVFVNDKQLLTYLVDRGVKARTVGDGSGVWLEHEDGVVWLVQAVPADPADVKRLPGVVPETSGHETSLPVRATGFQWLNYWRSLEAAGKDPYALLERHIQDTMADARAWGSTHAVVDRTMHIGDRPAESEDLGGMCQEPTVRDFWHADRPADA